MSIKIEASGKDVLDLVDRIFRGLEWLASKQMYLWRIEYTLEKLVKARNELGDMMTMAMETMEDAQRNGWSRRAPAAGWVREGLVFTDHADEVVARYKEEQLGGPGAGAGALHCPCEAVSRRALNARAIMRLNNILEHQDAGKKYATGAFEDVAYNRGGAEYHQVAGSLDDRLAALSAPPPRPMRRRLEIPPSLHDVEPMGYAAFSNFRYESEEVASGLRNRPDQSRSNVGKIQLNAFTKYRTFARSRSYESVPLVIRVNAPRHTHRCRAPIDLVMVLDVGEGMAADKKLGLLKQGSKFVVHNLEEKDRVSIVVFGDEAALLLPLINMSDEAKCMTNRLISSLEAAGDSKVELAMELAHKILRERPDDYRASSIMLLTDSEYHDRSSIETLIHAEKYPTYTFGFGSAHDPRPLYSLATRGHGTYSFVGENLECIRDAMALCIGGLTSIVAQDVKISVRSVHRDVRISDIMCGGYDCSMDDRGMSGSITVNDLCGSEEKKFIVYVNIPEEEAAIFLMTPKTKLLTVTANYICPLNRTDVQTDTIEVSVDRPRGQDRSISVEVASEVTRVNAFRVIKEIWVRSSECTHFETDWPVIGEELEKKLDNLRDAIGGTEEAKVAKDRWEDLGLELDNMRTLPYMLSWLSSHQWQRAATPGSMSESRGFSFRTVRMQNMIDSVGTIFDADISHQAAPIASIT